MSNKEEILTLWDSLHMAKTIGAKLGTRIELLKNRIERLKKTAAVQSGGWKSPLMNAPCRSS